MEEENGTLQKLRQLRKRYFVKCTIRHSKYALTFSDQRQALATGLPLSVIHQQSFRDGAALVMSSCVFLVAKKKGSGEVLNSDFPTSMNESSLVVPVPRIIDNNKILNILQK